VKTAAIALAEIKEKFRAAGLDSPETDARILIQHALGLSREDLWKDTKRFISISEDDALESYVARRLKREPVSRILGYRSFWKSDFKISKETLDPRADSETLIETVLKTAKPGSILDLGTGSGCLLLSLLQEWPEATGMGLDVSAGAVATAEENARALGLEGRSTFTVTDWNNYRPDLAFDIIISNPPYIAAHEFAGLEPEVTQYDPVRALLGGGDGLMCYRNIIQLLPQWLKPSGLVFFEVGHMQAADVKELLVQAGFSVLQTAQDLAGNDRCVAAQGP
jgi:release factor glutamine methyltransferase